MGVSEQDWLQAQYSVLGSALIEPDLVPRIITGTSGKDYSGSCLTVYNAMRDLAAGGQPVDVVSLAHKLGSPYHKFLADVMEITPTAANLDHYIKLCREQARILRLRDAGTKMMSISKMEDAKAILDEANGLMIDREDLRVVTMHDALTSFMHRHTTKKSYLTWPFEELTDRLYVEPGDFLILGGYPSAGKSALALQCAWHWAATKRVGFYSLETSAEKLFDRQIAAAFGISMDSIKRNTISDSEWERIAERNEYVLSRHLEIIPAAGMSVADVRAKATMQGHEIVVIDYLQLLQAKGSSRYEQVTNISMEPHTMAQTMGITVLALAQLSRSSRGTDAPGMESLRESGQQEQDADVILLLYLEDQDRPSGPRRLRIKKNKEGTCPGMVLEFDGKHQIFYKRHPEEAPPKRKEPDYEQCKI